MDVRRFKSVLRLWKRFWFRMLAYVLIVYAACCIAMYLWQGSLLFPREYAPAPLPKPAGAEALSHQRADGSLAVAWFAPAPDADAAHPAPAVIHCHGNAELISHQQHIIAGYHRLGVSVLLPEYRGYGGASGKPSQAGIRDDLAAFYDQVAQRPDVDSRRILFHGRSLGGGVAADLATVRRPAAIILESTFLNVGRMAMRYGMPPFLARNPYNTSATLPASGLPALIFHGSRDTLVPVSHGRRLAAMTPGARYVEYPANHNDLPGPEKQGAYWGEVEEFLQRTGVLSQAGAVRRGSRTTSLAPR